MANTDAQNALLVSAGALVISAISAVGSLVALRRQRLLSETRVNVAAEPHIYADPLSGAPRDVIRCLITNHSAHEVQVLAVELRFLRLRPRPRWGLLASLGNAFRPATIAARYTEEIEIPLDTLDEMAREAGWHQAQALIRVTVRIATKRRPYNSRPMWLRL